MDTDTLHGRLALVTGGGRGIGAAIARRLAARGAKVVVTGRSQAELAEVAAAIDGVAVVADLADRAATDAMVATVRALGRVDVLVNNAGIAESAPLADTDDAMWDRIMELNATAPFRLTRAFVPAMVAAGWGRVITIASNAGLTGYGYTAAYCAAKHAAVGMTRALAVDLGRTGVTVNAVCPGWVATRMAEEAIARIAAKTGRDTASATAALTGMSPQRRLIEPAEVAHAVAMLCGHDARGIHGQTIVLDGGQVLEVTARVEPVLVPGWPAPRGYANGMIGAGRTLCVAGQIGWDAQGVFHTDDLIGQFDQALANVVAVVTAAGAAITDLASMTIYVTDIEGYRARLKELGPVWRARLGKHFPAMALVAVAALVEPRAKVEIQATAFVP